jgi:pSer/pThr/pTyr-binding forkhead associated (FHA) protein
MRLSFPNGEHEDTFIGAGDTSIGAAADNTIVVGHSGVAPHHLRLSVNAQGIVLGVLDAQARTHVNTRPVREKALLRLGDVVSMDTLQFVLKPDRDDSIRTDLPPTTTAAPPPPGPNRINPARVLLRGLSGIQFGKIVPIRGKLVIGRGPGVDLALDETDMAPRQSAIENSGDAIYLRALDGNGSSAYVNGVRVRDAVVHAGDQIAFGRNRFVIEAPGMRARSEAPQAQAAPNITQTMRAIQLPDEADAKQPQARAERNNSNDIWWLIGAAAVIAVCMALLFLVKF